MTAVAHRIAGLDGLRAIAIGMVVVQHALGTRNLPSVRRLLPLGELGVRVFFVLSGFLITSLLVAEFRATGRVSLRRFYLRRAYRIFPAFYVFLAIMAILATQRWIAMSDGDLAFAATYTMNFHPDRAWSVGHLWSLAVEEQFYLIWPAVLWLLGPGRSLYVALGAIAAVPVLRVVAWTLWPQTRPMIEQAFPFVFDALAMGCALALARDRLERSPRYLAWLDARWFWLLPLAAAPIVLAQHPQFRLGLGMPIGSLTVALVIHRALRQPRDRGGRVLAWRPLVFVGTISYSLYLWQQPFVNRHAHAIVNAFPFHAVIAFAIAVASYYLVERPMLALRARRTGRQEAPA